MANARAFLYRGLGILLVFTGVLLLPLPVPLGVPCLAAGAALLLRDDPIRRRRLWRRFLTWWRRPRP